MRVLQVSSATLMGGGEQHLIELIGGLAGRGHVVELALRPRSPLGSVVAAGQVRAHEVPLRNSLDLASAWALRRIIQSSQIDVVHAHMARDYLVCAVAALGLDRARLVLTRHHYLPMRPNPLYRSLLGRVDKIIAVSGYVRDQLIRDGWEEKKVALVHNWLSPGRPPASDPPSGVPGSRRESLRRHWGLTQRLVVGAVGVLTEAKGHEDLVDAARQVAAKIRDVEFVLAGDDPAAGKPMERRLKEKIAAAGLSDRFHLVPRVEPLFDLLDALDVLVLPSWNEAFSLVLIEAMAAGLAVVATNAGGPAEIVRHGQTGWLVPPRDPAAMAGAIMPLLSNSSLRSALGASARSDVSARFDFKRAIDQIESIYRELFEVGAQPREQHRP